MRSRAARPCAAACPVRPPRQLHVHLHVLSSRPEVKLDHTAARPLHHHHVVAQTRGAQAILAEERRREDRME